MRVVRFFVFCAVLASLAWTIESCKDKGTEPPEGEFELSATSLNIVPGTTRTIVVGGGRPPYHVVEYPIPQIGFVYWEDLDGDGSPDSTSDPSSLKIEVISSATINDSTTVSVDDSNELNGGPLYIGVTAVAVGDVSYSDDIQPIWDGYCQNRGCHPGGGAPFSLDRFVSYTNLFFFPVSNSTCGARFRVFPEQPDSSQVYLMISGKTTCPRMPFSPLPGDTMALADQIKILDWITQGAANN